MKSSTSQHGFTLVELLVTVLIVGILVMAATAQIGGVNGAASLVRDRQNAQMLATIAHSAQAAGLDFVDEDEDVALTVAAISRGDTVRRGAFAGQFYGLPLGDGEAERARTFLRIRDGMLVYVAD